MRLLIDIGNTRIKWLCLAADALIPTQKQSNALSHQQNFVTAFEACFGVGSEFEKQFLDLPSSSPLVLGPTEVVVSNVAGRCAVAALTEFSEKSWQITPRYVDVRRDHAGIHNHYEVLTELGVDRWVAIIGARQYIPEGTVVIINCGTAITVDVLSDGDQFLGGAILPGFELAANALSRTDGIAKIPAETIQKAVGTTTQECVKLGVIAACVGGAESVVGKICSQLSSRSVTILLSGGAAQLFLDATSLECEYDANVIMRGLSRVVECES